MRYLRMLAAAVAVVSAATTMSVGTARAQDPGPVA